MTELLPRAFGELTLADVTAIIESIGDERETLFFERKLSVSGNSLAKVPGRSSAARLFGLSKACAAMVDPLPVERWSAPQFTGYLRKLFSVFVRSSTK